MFQGMRLVNLLLAVVFALIAVGTLIHTSENQANDIAYRMGQVVGNLLIFLPLITVFYLTWRGLSSDGTVSVIKKARIANVVAIVLIVLIFTAIGVLTNSSLSIWHWLVILMFVIPFVLNVKVLAKKRNEVNRSINSHEGDPVKAPEITISKEANDMSNTAQYRKLSKNYLARHWRGELSLGISYWVNGGILAGIVPIAIIAVVQAAKTENHSLRMLSLVVLLVILFSIVVWLWSIVGIWRSANHHVTRGGMAGWANAAKFMVVIGIFAMAGQLSLNIIPQAKELALIVIGNDPLGEVTIKVAANGQSVIVVGALREGSASEVQKILDAAPSAASLVLNSNGGRLYEAQLLAQIVRSRGLNTYVEDQCLSACTYVFLAGKDRAATPNARIGFHQPSFPGYDAAAARSATQEMVDIYRAAGLSEPFVQRISKTPPDDMWYPTRDELISSHVITRVSLGGEAGISGIWMNSKQELFLHMRSIPLLQAIERRFPKIFNEALERGWSVKERGGSDADIMNAVRSVISEIHPILLRTADASTLDVFLKLMIDEMKAARAVSVEACSKLLDSKLDITKTLPREIVEREEKYLMQALTATPRMEVESPNPEQVQKVFQLVMKNMPQQYINVMTNMKSYENQPELVCGTIITFYQGIEALPADHRIIALQGLFQNGE